MRAPAHQCRSAGPAEFVNAGRDTLRPIPAPNPCPADVATRVDSAARAGTEGGNPCPTQAA